MHSGWRRKNRITSKKYKNADEAFYALIKAKTFEIVMSNYKLLVLKPAI
jgi:hypothetical protein